MEGARKTEGGKIEMPLPHIGNINPPFREYKKKEKGVTVRFYMSSDSIYSNVSFT